MKNKTLKLFVMTLMTLASVSCNNQKGYEPYEIDAYISDPEQITSMTFEFIGEKESYSSTNKRDFSVYSIARKMINRSTFYLKPIEVRVCNTSVENTASTVNSFKYFMFLIFWQSEFSDNRIFLKYRLLY